VLTAPTLTPIQAYAQLELGAHLIDVREPNETALGYASGAQRLPRAQLLTALTAQHLQDGIILLICQSGVRSNMAAQELSAAGFTQVFSVVGGCAAWQQAALPWHSAGRLSTHEQARYSRQLLLPELGAIGQEKLRQAKVLLIGAGGLGSPAALYLAAAGVGTLGISDGDRVDVSNLHRQILHRTDTIDMLKTDSATAQLGNLNPLVKIETLPALDAENIDALLPRFDLIVDGSDNFATRFLVSDACVKHKKPLIYGAVLRFEGQVSVFLGTSDTRGAAPCYRCLFPAAPAPEHAPSCAQAGVLGVVPGVIGTLQATEAIKLITGIGTPLSGRLLMFDAKTTRFREVRVPRDPHCPACAPGAVIHYARGRDYCEG
jgi:sulfur-carrier protein adenylyltransferase/sulfurtransferase